MKIEETGAFASELVGASLRVTASRASIDALARERLAAVLRAAERTRLHGGRRLETLADARPITKAEHAERFDDTVVDPRLTRARVQAFLSDARPGSLLLDRYVVATTSGTTGQLGVFLDDVTGIARQRAIVFARIFRGLLTPKGFALLTRRRYRLAFVIATGGHWLTSILATRIPKVGQLVADSRVFPIDRSLPALVAELNAFEPMLLHGYPTFIEVLCAEKRRGALRIEPEIVSCGSEPTTQSVRDAVRAAFPRARLVDSYASTECLALATTCPLGEMHQNEDACVLEPVDDAHQPVREGERSSRVLVTNLLNLAQPLVRYELTDSIELVPGLCGCGSPLRRVRVHGRTDDTLYLIDGAGQVQAHPPIPWEIAFLGVQGLSQYQLVHESQNRLRTFFVADAGADAQAVADRIEAQLAGYLDGHGLLSTVSFTVEQVESIERHARSKKLRQITSRVARPPGAVVSALSSRR